jgi:DNA-binding response OmpR family regulator
MPVICLSGSKSTVKVTILQPSRFSPFACYTEISTQEAFLFEAEKVMRIAARVLLVDGGGDGKSAGLIETMLVAKGYEVSAASSLADAGDYLSRSDPDVILLDTELPDGSGIAFCAGIRDATNAHILFRTSCESVDELKRALGAGGNIYFNKSERAEEVAARVDAAMRRRKKNSSERLTK